MNDIKHGVRMLARNPGFALASILTLAIGIGANVAMFSVVRAVLLRPLPFEAADRLVVVQQRSRVHGWTSGLSYPDFQDWRAQNQAFEDFAAYTPDRVDLVEAEGTSKIQAAQVSTNFFSLLKVSAHLGRTFNETDRPGSSGQVAVISHDFWQRRLGGQPEVLGRTITLRDRAYTIIGVLPIGFTYPESIGDAQIWTLLNPTGDALTNRSYCWLCTVGRLEPGLSVEQALPLLNALHHRLSQGTGGSDSEVLLTGVRDMVVGGVRTTLWILSAVVGFILLIVCTNVANLCLAKVSSRAAEVAVRRALGASRLQVFRQFTTESLLLSLAGGILGLILTAWTVSLFKARIADVVPMAGSIRIEPQELLFGLAVSLAVGFLLGIAPLWLILEPAGVSVLAERQGTSRHPARLSHALVASQIAAALILSIGMGLMIRSMGRLSSASTGFNRDNLVTFNVGMREGDPVQRSRCSGDFAERLRSLPTVKAVSTDSSMPSAPWGASAPVSTEGFQSPDGKPVRAMLHNVGPGYFETLQVPLLRGRTLAPEEHQRKDKVVVISENLAHRFWPDQDPIGRELTCCGQRFRVVGVATDMIQGNVRIAKPHHVFLPFDTLFPGSELTFVVRTESDPGPVIQQARAILKDIDVTLPLYDVSTFRAQMNRWIMQERFTTTFLTVFAIMALLLIIIGIYGVVSHTVVQRTREIGIRMALGAQRTGIMALILKRGLLSWAIGSSLGIAGAVGLTRFLSGCLYEISTTDPATFVLGPVLITGVSMLACIVPARRAARIDPMEALRCE
jgi:putative ABC transport system permease protein